MNLGNVIRFWSGWNPDGAAVIVGDRVVSWLELDASTSRIANGLAAMGIGHDDRVGMLSNNALEYLELAIAGYKLGSVLVPLNVRLTPPELRFIIEHAGCRTVVADAELAESAAAALDGSNRTIGRIGLAAGFGTPFAELRNASADDPGAAVQADDVAYICYTSGTTGTPKGAMLSHGNVLAMSHNSVLVDNLNAGCRSYLPFPLSFTGGLVSMWAPAYVGGATLVLDTAVEPLRALETIQSRRITHFNAVPVLWEPLLNHPDFGSYDLSSLRIAGSGGAAVPESLLQGLQAAGIPMSQGYGLTEGAGKNTWLRAEDAARKLGSCGRPLMHTQVRTVDENLLDVATGEIGELLIKGPEVMLGYWNDPEATAKTLVDGWLCTGDLARIDDEGYVYIVDRAKDMLISGGLNVYPAEIEAWLMGFPGVSECAVIGVPDDKWGETPAALVGALPGVQLEPAALLAHCRGNLADYKWPRYIVIRDEPLPRGMSGKVLKRELRQTYADTGSLGEPLR
jgi:fatty-acyl-CoA synthase